MNRRALLKLIGLAPMAAPAIARAAATPSPLYGKAILGKARALPAGVSDIVVTVHAPASPKVEAIARDVTLRALRAPRAGGIEAQMREHDLFHLSDVEPALART